MTSVQNIRILLTNHHLENFAGTENATFLLARLLKAEGCQVTVYAKYLSRIWVKKFDFAEIELVSNLELIRNRKFHLIHAQHNICAYEARYYFPNIPMLMWVHGLSPFLEQIPLLDIKIDKFIVNNRSLKNHLLDSGVAQDKICIIRNLIDSRVFFPKKPIHDKPKRALIISNKIGAEKEKLLKEIFTELKIKAKFVGKRFREVQNSQLPDFINKADIVFTLGLGAIESMFCGRIPIIYDNHLHGDGMVTIENFEQLMEYNFSGKALKKDLTKNDLINEINKYQSKEGCALMEKARSFYEAQVQVQKVLEIYQKVIGQFSYSEMSEDDSKKLSEIVKIISETQQYSRNNLFNIFQSSKVFQIWQGYNQFLKSLGLKHD